MNPFRAVQGNLWKKVDIQEWNEKSYLAFFECVNRFTRIKDGEQKIVVSTEDLMKLEQDAFSGQYPFLMELVTRIDQMTTDPKATPHKFYVRFVAILRQVGAYIKQHPSIVTDEMRKVIEANARIAWCLVHYENKVTKIGATIVTETKLDNVDANKEVMSNPHPQLMSMETELKLVDLANRMIKGVKVKDLRHLSTKDRIMLALAITKSNRGSRPAQVGTFNQLVINKAGREDLEKAMLEFNKNKL